MSTPLVSVIISAYNVERYIEEAIESILHQDYANMEIVIADDLSTDRTRIIIDSISDPRIRRYHNSENVGYLRTWNKLLATCTGAYITFQDADDVSHPHRIKKLVDFLEQHPTIGLCGSNFIRFFKPWGLYMQSNYPLSHSEIEKQVANGRVPFIGTRVMIRQEVYREVGGFREYFHGLTWEDYDWILRIMEKFSVANIPDVLYEYRYYSRSQSKQGFDTSVRKLLVEKVGFFLAEQRKKDGVDALQKKSTSEIEDFIKDDIAFLNSNPRIKFYRISNNLISNKDFVSAILAYWRWIKSHPLSFREYFYVFIIVNALARTIIKSFFYKLTKRDRYKLI